MTLELIYLYKIIAPALFVGCNITSCDTDIGPRVLFIINKIEARQDNDFFHF